MSTYTTQKEVNLSFWESIPGLNVYEERKYKKLHGDYRCNVRCAFVDYVDSLCKNGQITDKLAQKVTLK